MGIAGTQQIRNLIKTAYIKLALNFVSLFFPFYPVYELPFDLEPAALVCFKYARSFFFTLVVYANLCLFFWVFWAK